MASPTSLGKELPLLQMAQQNVESALSGLLAMNLTKSRDKKVVSAAQDFTNLAQSFVSAIVYSSPHQLSDDPAFLSVAAVIVACEIAEGVSTILTGYAAQSANKAPNFFGRLASSVSHVVRKLSSSDPAKVPERALKAYSAAMSTLAQILLIDIKATPLKCRLIEDPTLGRTSEDKSPKPLLPTAAQAVQEQALFVNRLMGCIAEGADILAPLKAACLALELIVQHVKKACTVHEQQERLLNLMRSWWKRLATLLKKVHDSESPALHDVFTIFHCDMLRITVELTMVDNSDIKSALIADTVLDFIREKERNLQDAEWGIVLTTMTITAGDVVTLSNRLRRLDEKLQESSNQVRTGLQDLLRSFERAEREQATHRKYLVEILVGVLVCIVGIVLAIAIALGTSLAVDDSRMEQRKAFRAADTNFAETKDLIRELRPYVEVTRTGSINFTQYFSKPDLVRGRDQEIRGVVDAILASTGANIAILGQGGIGKTTVALSAIFDAEVKQRFEDRLYLISSESTPHANSLMAVLGRQLNLSSTPDMLPKVVRYFENQPPSLLFIDNVETIWISKDKNVASGAENALRALASISHLVLVVTIRGADAPRIFKFKNRFHIPALSLEDARNMFTDVAPAPEYPSSEALALDELLREVDGLPLAIELLARLSAIPGTTPSVLLECWKDSRDILEIELSGLHKSIGRSVNVSLSFLPDDPEPLQLLALCSQLPDGLRGSIFKRLKDGRKRLRGGRLFHHIDNAVQALEISALVFRDAAGTYRSLNPIRLYIMHVYPPEPMQYDALLDIYLNIALMAIERGPTPAEASENVAELLREYANIESVLLRHAQGDTEISSQFLALVRAMTQFTNAVPSSCALVHACLDRLMPNEHEKGHITRERLVATYLVAKCYVRRHDIELGIQYLERTLKLASAATPGSAEIRANAHLDMGLQLMETRQSDAISHLRRAAAIFSSLGLQALYTLAMTTIASLESSEPDSNTLVDKIRECDKLLAQGRLEALSCVMLLPPSANLDAEQLATVQLYAEKAQAFLKARGDIDAVAYLLDLRMKLHCKPEGCDKVASEVIAEARDLARLPHISKTAEARLAPILARDLVFQGKVEEALALVERAAVVAKAGGMDTTAGQLAMQAKALKAILATKRQPKSS